jgi:hypothetical protein
MTCDILKLIVCQIVVQKTLEAEACFFILGLFCDCETQTDFIAFRLCSAYRAAVSADELTDLFSQFGTVIAFKYFE